MDPFFFYLTVSAHEQAWCLLLLSKPFLWLYDFSDCHFLPIGAYVFLPSQAVKVLGTSPGWKFSLEQLKTLLPLQLWMVFHVLLHLEQFLSHELKNLLSSDLSSLHQQSTRKVFPNSCELAALIPPPHLTQVCSVYFDPVLSVSQTG